MPSDPAHVADLLLTRLQQEGLHLPPERVTALRYRIQERLSWVLDNLYSKAAQAEMDRDEARNEVALQDLPEIRDWLLRQPETPTSLPTLPQNLTIQQIFAKDAHFWEELASGYRDRFGMSPHLILQWILESCLASESGSDEGGEE